MENPTCDICPGQTPMEQIERLPNKKKKRGGGSYRVRRFQCPICGHQQTIHADGTLDIDRYENELDQALQERREQDQREQDERNEKFD